MTDPPSDRRRISSQSPWEDLYGYSRALVVGRNVHVSGTTGTDAHGRITGDVIEQTRTAIEKIRAALESAGAHLEDVVRARIYVVGQSNAEPVARAYGEAFRPIKPAATLIVVAGLLLPEMLVEIEVDAVIASPRSKKQGADGLSRDTE